ncbi:MAG: pilus assembly protein [Oceanicaulis sp.]|nr:pilus assembly protein [Oceanicaulis sp.]
MVRKVISWLKDRRGGMAVEMALIAPVLVLAMLGAADLAQIGLQRSDMLSAARAGTQYFIAGGTDVERARQIVERSWTAMPDGGQVVVNRSCECGGVTASCIQLCTDGSPPDIYALIELQAEVDGVFQAYQTVAHDKVRVR